MPVENRGTARRPQWRYAFTIRGVRYRAVIPEARTKFEAEQGGAGGEEGRLRGAVRQARGQS